MRECDRGDPEVVRSDRLSTLRETRPGVGVHAGDWLGDRDRLPEGELLQGPAAAVRPAPRSHRPGGKRAAGEGTKAVGILS